MVTAESSPELVGFAHEGRRRFEAGDADWFEQTTAYGEVSSFGTAPEEQARGREAVLALTMEQIGEMNENAGLDIAAHEQGGEGDVVGLVMLVGSSPTAGSPSRTDHGRPIES